MVEYITTTRVRKNSGGSDVGTQRRLNFIEGTNVTLTIVNDPSDGEVDVQIAATGGGGGTVDTSGTPVANDIARFTDADTIEGRSYTELKADLDLEIGTDVLAQKTIGIADNNLAEVDGPGAGAPANGEYVKWTASGLEGKTFAELRTDINVADGAVAAHGALDGLGDDDHTQYIKHSLATVLNDFLVASGSGTFVKKNLAETIIILAHASAHQNGGVDEVSIIGLSGLLADDQHVLDTEVTNVAIAKTTVDAQSVLGGVSDNTPVAIAVAEQRLVGRITSGNITALDAAQILTLIGVTSGADVTGSNPPQGHSSSHEDTGGDEINVGALSGTLADDQHVLDAEVVAAAIAITTLTTRGDIIYRGVSAPTRLAKGTDGQFLKIGANDPEWATVSAGATLTVAESEVYNGAAPTSWTDLNLSGTVGSQATLVLLKLIGYNLKAVRKNGDTDEFYNVTSTIGGCALSDLSSTHIVLLVATDNSGIIEWRSEDTQNTIIDIIAYIK